MSLPIPKCVGVYKQHVFINNMKLMEIIVQVDKENNENHDVRRFINVLMTNCYSYHTLYNNDDESYDDEYFDIDDEYYQDKYELSTRERYTTRMEQDNHESENFVGYIYKFYFDTSDTYYLNNGPFHLPIPQKCWVLKLENDDIEISYDTRYTTIDTERLNKLLYHYHIASYQYYKNSVYMYYSKN